MANEQGYPAIVLFPSTYPSGDHAVDPPAIEVTEHDYLGYFRSLTGAQLLFVQRVGESIATLYHSDHGWRGFAVTATLIQKAIVTRETPGLLFLDSTERDWLVACWLASHDVRTQLSR